MVLGFVLTTLMQGLVQGKARRVISACRQMGGGGFATHHCI